MEAQQSEAGQSPLLLQLWRRQMLYEAVPVTAAQTPQPLAVYLLPAELPYPQLSGHFLEKELHVVWCSWLMPLRRYFQVRPCNSISFLSWMHDAIKLLGA